MSVTQLLPDVPFALAECPIWDDRRQCLFWVDITAGRLHALWHQGARHESWGFDEKISCIGLTEGGDLLVAGISGIWRFGPEDGARVLWAQFPPQGAGMRPNDGKIGPDGAFWVGTMEDRDDRGAKGSLFRFAADGSVRQALSGLVTPNGLEWSPDGRQMYLAETRALQVTRWTFDRQTGQITAPEPFVTLKAEQGKPDGAVVDASGTYWICGIYAGKVLAFDPEGRLLHEIEVGTAMVTMPCFGGPALDLLFVTSLSRGDDTPGGLRRVVVDGARGLPARRMPLP